MAHWRRAVARDFTTTPDARQVERRRDATIIVVILFCACALTMFAALMAAMYPGDGEDGQSVANSPPRFHDGMGRVQ